MSAAYLPTCIYLSTETIVLRRTFSETPTSDGARDRGMVFRASALEKKRVALFPEYLKLKERKVEKRKREKRKSKVCERNFLQRGINIFYYNFVRHSVFTLKYLKDCTEKHGISLQHIFGQSSFILYVCVFQNMYLRKHVKYLKIETNYLKLSVQKLKPTKSSILTKKKKLFN
ncbi:hypothetical protein PUN28_017656 [Cardiocondyla obscurior]|uniref:Uncharacterized protein n=1 Tax=Cardiocondyla obscurior TaxID=286306 RepID=A0AAW2EPC5_9HYME